ncbi:MAG: L,D-transpeptidase [Oscillatoriales cyanobacterium]|nr:MAG: L,D-transpeptidase [Oscillatoriales cyanobacterium]
MIGTIGSGLWVAIGALPALAADPPPSPLLTGPWQQPIVRTAQPSLPGLGQHDPHIPLPAPEVVQPVQPSVQQSAQQLVLRLRERRVYLYEGDRPVRSYPVAIGRAGWETPTGQFQVIQKMVNPIWQHPFNGTIIPAGKDNPLGVRWIGFWTDGDNSIGFHGTPNPELIGQAVSHGCVRMHNDDIVDLFDRVTEGTPVRVEP